jgi:hypothetical protein
MKTFKTFISETKETKKEPVLITNTHGSHSKKKQPVLITNTHGSHAKKKNPYLNVKESETENKSETWEEFSSKNPNPSIEGSYQEQMDHLNKLHPLNPESHDHIKKYTASSSGLSDHFIKSHVKGENPIPSDPKNQKVWGHDVAELDKTITSHKLKTPLTTFTGVGFNPENLDSNKAITHLSSSISPKIARGFSAPDTDAIPGKIVYHVLKHHLKEGMSATVIGSHTHHKDGWFVSNYPEEHEVLLPRTDATKEKLHLHFSGHTDYPNQFGEVVRIHDTTWKSADN